MGGIAKQNGMIPKCIGGVSDHETPPSEEPTLKNVFPVISEASLYGPKSRSRTRPLPPGNEENWGWTIPFGSSGVNESDELKYAP